MMEISVSDLYEFKSCPLRYKLTKIDKLTTKVTENDGFREAMYSTISYFYLHLQDGKLLGMEHLKEKFSRLFNSSTAIYDVHADDRKKRKRELEAFNILMAFHRQQKYYPDQVIAVNLDFRMPFGDLVITGKIPLIRETSRGVELVNFKLANHKADEFWQYTDMGLTLQAMAYHSMFKKEVDSMALHYLKLGTTIYTERKKEHYQRLFKSVKLMKKTMDEGWYYPRESYHCDQCPVKDLCMEWR